MDRNFCEPFQSFLNLATGVARATWLLRRCSKMGQMLVHSSPCQFLESLTSELFILLSAKEREQVFAGQIILGYKAKYLGDYLWLSALLSHTSKPVPLRAGVRWPLYLRLEGTGPEEETSKMGRAWASHWPQPTPSEGIPF